MPIKDFFSTYGEEKFRQLESEVIRGLVGRGGIVIATGGGAILRNENIANLKYNGRLYFIDRPLDKLIATDTRPLSSDRASIEQRYKERYSIYCGCCDERVEADANAQTVADRILENF
jgi:shikimate kinase